MALTTHQILHLQAHIDNIDADKLRPEMIAKLKSIRGETESQYAAYTDRMKARAKGFMNLPSWPPGLGKENEIHDFLDEERD